MLTTNELTDALTLEAGAAPTNLDRLDQVHGRVNARRRRRAAAAGLASIAVLAVGLGVLLPHLGSSTSTTPPTATPSPSASGLPEYLRGGRLLAQSETTGAGGATLTFTPATLEFGWVQSCVIPNNPDPSNGVYSQMTLNGHPLGGTSCGEILGLDGTSDMALAGPGWNWADFDVRVGQPSTLVATFDGSVAQSAKTRIAIYQAVPWDEFPFPAAPDPLPSADSDWVTQYDNDPDARRFLTAKPPESRGFTYTVPITKELQIEALTVAPGELRVYADDRLIWTFRSWEYSEGAQAGATVTLKELGIASGEKIGLRLEADRFPADDAGSWEVRFYDFKPALSGG